MAGEILATFSAFKAALQCHFPLAPKIKPTILFRLFSTRVIFSLPLRIGISTMRHVLGDFFTLYSIKALKTCVIVYKFFRLYVRRIRRISSSYKPCAKNYFQNQPKLSEFRRSHRAGFLDVRLACHFFTYPFLVRVPVSASRSSNSVIAKNSRTT